MPAVEPGAVTETWFQSAPGREAGRCHTGWAARRCSTKLFQSAPGREAGRCLCIAYSLNHLRNVSIRARP